MKKKEILEHGIDITQIGLMALPLIFPEGAIAFSILSIAISAINRTALITGIYEKFDNKLQEELKEEERNVIEKVVKRINNDKSIDKGSLIILRQEINSRLEVYKKDKNITEINIENFLNEINFNNTKNIFDLTDEDIKHVIEIYYKYLSEELLHTKLLLPYLNVNEINSIKIQLIEINNKCDITKEILENHENMIVALGTEVSMLKTKFDEHINNPSHNKPNESNHNEICNPVEEYKNDFDKYLFLEDKTTQIIKLSDMYISPDYIEKSKRYTDAYNRLECFTSTPNESKCMIIVGDPSIGKSSLLYKFIYKHYEEGNNDVIFLKFKDLNEHLINNSEIVNIIDVILKMLYDDISNVKQSILSNKTIILDGYDEASILYNQENNDMIPLFEQLKSRYFKRTSSIKNTKLIITTRTNYINNSILEESHEYRQNVLNIIKLLPFTPKQIGEYCNRFWQKRNKSIDYKININEEEAKLYGIPMLLYIICYNDIKLNDIKSKADLYYKVFSRDGHLLKGMNEDKFDNTTKNELYKIPLKISFIMYRMYNTNNPINYHYDTKGENFNDVGIELFDGIKDTELKDKIENMFGIAHYYKEGIKDLHKIEFVHKSLYEYFLAEYMYSIILEISLCNKSGDNEKVLELIYETFRWHHVIKTDDETYNYLKHIVSKNKNDLINNEGLIYHIDYLFMYNFLIKNSDREKIYDIINIITINYIGLLYTIYGEEKKLIDNLNKVIKNSEYYDNYTHIIGKNEFSNIYLIGANLDGANLSGANLSGANLSGANLSGAYLILTSLSGADLSGADLRGASLGGSDLILTSLSGADLRGANLHKALLYRADLIEARLIGATFSYDNIEYIEKIEHRDINSCYVINKNSKKLKYTDYCKERNQRG